MARITPRKGKVYHKGQPYQDYESYTSISKWLNCPIVFAQAYWSKEREATTLPLIFGQAFHGLVEDILIHKQLSGEEMILEAAKRRWEQRWLVELKFTEPEFGGHGIQIHEVTPEKFLEQGLACTEIFIKSFLPTIEPRDVEQDFMITLKDIDRKIFGKLDFTQPDPELDDLKTSGRAFSKAEEEYELQFAIYHVGHYDLYHQWPKRSRILRVETSHMPDIEWIDMSLSRDRVQEIFDVTVRPTMVQISESWKTGIFQCTCGKHKALDFFKEDAKYEAELLRKQEETEKILNPQQKEITREDLPKIVLEKTDVEGIPF